MATYFSRNLSTFDREVVMMKDVEVFVDRLAITQSNNEELRIELSHGFPIHHNSRHDVVLMISFSNGHFLVS